MTARAARAVTVGNEIGFSPHPLPLPHSTSPSSLPSFIPFQPFLHPLICSQVTAHTRMAAPQAPMAPVSRQSRPEIVGGDAPESPYPLELFGTVTPGFGRGARFLGIPTGKCCRCCVMCLLGVFWPGSVFSHSSLTFLARVPAYLRPRLHSPHCTLHLFTERCSKGCSFHLPP